MEYGEQGKLGMLGMVRVQFLIGILIPLIVGTLISVIISGSFHVWGFVFVVITGLGLHLATNVYNDIYDTVQGVDKSGADTRNFVSGGSGVLLQYPDRLPKFVLVARFGVILSFCGLIGLLIVVDRFLWPFLLVIYGVSVFLSKYYTAAPWKLGYRGFGEILVWLSFGPMAVFLAGLSQNIGLHFLLVEVMPVTGLSTLSILWMGQLMDIENDEAAGKRGMIIRLGTKRAVFGYIFLQALLIINVAFLGVIVFHPGWPIFFSLIPYVVLLPVITQQLLRHHADPAALIPVGKRNATLYVLFSFLFILGIMGYLVLVG
jgi:1,4-dihydroxy-2-naphthoate octaprenyltransferase